MGGCVRVAGVRPAEVWTMRVRMTDGEVLEAQVTSGHAASNYGVPVLVVNGEALGTADAAGLAIVEATAGERDDLLRAGYRLAVDADAG